MKIKVNICFGDDIIASKWQTKTFSNEMSALEFIRKHRTRIFGINDYFGDVAILTPFEIMDLIRSANK